MLEIYGLGFVFASLLGLLSGVFMISTQAWGWLSRPFSCYIPTFVVPRSSLKFSFSCVMRRGGAIGLAMPGPPNGDAMGTAGKGMSLPPTLLVQPAIVSKFISVRLCFVLHRYRGSVQQETALTFISIHGVSLSVRSSLRTFSSYGIMIREKWQDAGWENLTLLQRCNLQRSILPESVLYTFIDLTNCMCAIQLPLLRFARAKHLLSL
jgi:hypothetical protein